MAKKVPYAQECSAASDLLRRWGVCPEDEFIPKQILAPVIERYTTGLLYHYGPTLFTHLAAAATMPNRWVTPGMENPARALEEFLSRTTCPANPMNRGSLTREFAEIAGEVKTRYGADLAYNDALNPFENIRAARRESVRLWAAERAAKTGR